jgi:hypothetical protein
MNRSVYIAICNKCGLVSAIPAQHAQTLIQSREALGEEPAVMGAEASPLTVSRCAVMTETDAGPEHCDGVVIIEGVTSLGLLPTARQILAMEEGDDTVQ